jgi:type II secretory pathway pseudopilin PulG
MRRLINRPSSITSRETERGSALLSVLVVLLVLGILAGTLAVVVTNTTAGLGSTRDTIQSRAAADAGIASAVAAVRATTGDPCALAPPSGTDPDFTVTATCDASAQTITFTSVGRGDDGGETRVQAAYSYTSATAEDVGGSAHMTFFGSATFTYETQALSEGLLNIAIPSGNFTCQATVHANIVLSGNFSGNGSCDVLGSVVAGGTITTCCTGDRIRGDAIAAGTATSGFRGTVDGDFIAAGPVTIDGGASGVRVGGDLQAGGNVRLLQASVGGKLTLPSANSVCVGPACATTVSGNTHAQVGEAIHRGSPTPPAAPVFESWFDYVVPARGSSAYAMWAAEEWPGYTTWALSTTECSAFNTGNALAWNTLGNLTVPTIIDARGCPSNGDGPAGFLTSNPGGMKSSALKTSLVFLATGVKLTNLTLSAAPGASPKVRFIVPDGTDNDRPDTSPNCYWGNHVTINHVDFSVPTMAYTPGCINVSGGGEWRGALYGGAFNYGGALEFWGESIALPGMSNTVPGVGSETTIYTLGSLISQRDLP